MKYFITLFLFYGFLQSQAQMSFGSLSDCESKESYTTWTPIDSLNTCDHVWVYAEWKDVNTTQNWTTLQYCPCGCGGSSNEARICSLCKLNQSRIRQYWYESVQKKSDYQKLLETKVKN